MYNRKNLGPRMKPWGTSALTGYSYEDLLSRTTLSCLLLRKDEIFQKFPNWPKVQWDLNLWRRPPCQSLSKAWDISSATAWVASDQLKTPVKP